MKYFNTITQISVGQATDNPVYGECVRIKLEDECGGMFLVFEQDDHEGEPRQVRIGFDEWDNICQAVLTLKNQPPSKISCNEIVKALVGSTELAKTWWVTPNLAFNMQTPVSQNTEKVYQYLLKFI